MRIKLYYKIFIVKARNLFVQEYLLIKYTLLPKLTKKKLNMR